MYCVNDIIVAIADHDQNKLAIIRNYISYHYGYDIWLGYWNRAVLRDSARPYDFIPFDAKVNPECSEEFIMEQAIKLSRNED